jgi:hypothetical protein
MWPFGRKNEPVDESRCASCGRTLLAGEWTQRIIEDDGSEALICSLCSQSRSGRSAPVDTMVANGDQRLPTNGRETKRKSDAFWLALKEKDAEIEDLRARLARTEAEKKLLAGCPPAWPGATPAPASGDATALEAASDPARRRRQPWYRRHSGAEGVCGAGVGAEPGARQRWVERLKLRPRSRAAAAGAASPAGPDAAWPRCVGARRAARPPK